MLFLYDVTPKHRQINNQEKTLSVLYNVLNRFCIAATAYLKTCRFQLALRGFTGLYYHEGQCLSCLESDNNRLETYGNLFCGGGGGVRKKGCSANRPQKKGGLKARVSVLFCLFVTTLIESRQNTQIATCFSACLEASNLFVRFFLLRPAAPRRTQIQDSRPCPPKVHRHRSCKAWW